jgi:hypothetical protein
MQPQIYCFIVLACAIIGVVCQEPIRIVAVADLHADYDNSVSVLQMADVVDENVKWKGSNNTVFVQTVGTYLSSVKKHYILIHVYRVMLWIEVPIRSSSMICSKDFVMKHIKAVDKSYHYLATMK